MIFLKNKKLVFLAIIILLLITGLTLAVVAYVPSLTEVTVEAYDGIKAEDFSIENAVILFKYRNGSIKTMQVTEDMLSDEDLAKLTTPGRHTVAINYEKRKSVQTEINLLRGAKSQVVLNRILQGLQKTAVDNNINGEFEFSAYYQKQGEARKEYTLSLKFTLDIDQHDGAENYLGLEITEDKNVLLGIYYKDDKQYRPNLYLKSDGPFVPLMSKTENKFKSVSADEYFGDAKAPTEEELWTVDFIIDSVLSFVGDAGMKPIVNTVLNLLLNNAALSDDGLAASINIDMNNILKWLPLAALAPGIMDTANNFLSSFVPNLTLNDTLKGISEPPTLRLKVLFDDNGALRSLDLKDDRNNSAINNSLHLSVDKKINAGINVQKVSLRADDSSFTLPTDKGIEDWEEGEVSFERWVLWQYNRMIGEAQPQPDAEGIISYRDIDYVGDDSVFHKLDVYRPQDKGQDALPVIINIHGGGWTAGSKEATLRYCQYLSLQGFAVVNINYHLLPHAVMPEPMQDIFAAFNFVMDEDNAELYGFDTDNVFLTGDSAGGHYAMLALSVLVDPELSALYGVSSDIAFNAAGVNSTGFTFTEVLKLPLPFAHFYVNQFFSDELPYTAYRDDPRYIDMARSLNLENNKIERFPPMFVSSAHGDTFSVHSDRLIDNLEKAGVEYIYDFREFDDIDNPERYFLGHDFNINALDWTVSKAVNNALCDFFKQYLTE